MDFTAKNEFAFGAGISLGSAVAGIIGQRFIS
jgi:hypothetical protein